MQAVIETSLPGEIKGMIMVFLQGKGAMTDVNLVVTGFDNAKYGNRLWLDVEVDPRDERVRDNTNLHLVTRKVELADGHERYSHDAPYSDAQIDAILKAAGPVEPVKSDTGERIGWRFGLQACVMPREGGKGLAINTRKSMRPSAFGLDGLAAARQARRASRQARQAEDAAPAAQTSSGWPEQETPDAGSVEEDEAAPAVG